MIIFEKKSVYKMQAPMLALYKKRLVFVDQRERKSQRLQNFAHSTSVTFKMSKKEYFTLHRKSRRHQRIEHSKFARILKFPTIPAAEEHSALCRDPEKKKNHANAIRASSRPEFVYPLVTCRLYKTRLILKKHG